MRADRRVRDGAGGIRDGDRSALGQRRFRGREDRVPVVVRRRRTAGALAVDGELPERGVGRGEGAADVLGQHRRQVRRRACRRSSRMWSRRHQRSAVTSPATATRTVRVNAMMLSLGRRRIASARLARSPARARRHSDPNLTCKRDGRDDRGAVQARGFGGPPADGPDRGIEQRRRAADVDDGLSRAVEIDQRLQPKTGRSVAGCARGQRRLRRLQRLRVVYAIGRSASFDAPHPPSGYAILIVSVARGRSMVKTAAIAPGGTFRPGRSRASAGAGRELAVAPRRRSLRGDDLDRSRRRPDPCLRTAADTRPRPSASASDPPAAFFASIGVPAAAAARDASATIRK